MPQSNQEYTAWRFKSFDNNYECELPPDVRAEFRRPKRARVLRYPSDPGSLRRLILSGFVVLAVIAGGIATWTQQQSKEPVKTGKAISEPIPAPTSQRTLITPMPTPEPAPTPHTSWQSYIAAHQAPRAMLVKLSPPRAQLVRLPDWNVGETRPVMMPYNIEVLARYKGRLTSEAILPTDGNSIGDTWAVGDNVWVWLVAPGTSTAQMG
jgi:hypothetical protein